MKANLELKNTNLLQFIIDDRYRILRHVVFLVASLVVISYSNWQVGYPEPLKYYRLFCVYGVLITICYINMYFLVPVFFFRGRHLLYLVLLSLLVFLSLTFMATLFHAHLISGEIPQVGNYRGFFEGFFITVSIVLITTMIKLFQRWTKDNDRIAELKNITLRMELNELRNQINPHFFFNMLNGIKALIRTDPEKANLVIMKLSEFLRYQIYENNEAQTLLSSEIIFLSNFLDLEMLRRDHLVIDVSVPDTSGILNGIFIPPNLFTTFVENAVKHSVNISGGQSHIGIKIALFGNQLHFSCTNSIDPNFILTDQKNSGLGLSNIKRRLELLYHENYSMTVNSTENQFTITLILPL
ncbi:GHKL domain-containing protein [Pedobacter sp. ok626]|uniref:sensor histidine kinase n=1 Tax=Pedobacter sp. ok626 TaxID=1761882 RepID=UPI000891157B|nr:histidine kinase [Pedobacter sp. ok626]SDK52923.1 GHKL domain-containing protein [Pedobacter sp. ok626]